MKRKRRVGEVICRCGAYRFPHRMMGGRCDGGALVYKTFEEQAWGSCRDCHFRIDDDDQPLHCQVLEGQDKVIHCPELQEFIRYNEIRLYGENANPDIENPKRRRKRR